MTIAVHKIGPAHYGMYRGERLLGEFMEEDDGWRSTVYFKDGTLRKAEQGLAQERS